MLASPSIQQIASALARPTLPTTRTPSRILCLKLYDRPSQGGVRPSKKRSMKAVAESFLKFSPRVQLRETAKETKKESTLASKAGAHSVNAWIFLDIASTSHLFKGEEGLMQSAMSLARDLGFGVQCAVADTPAGAQAFATSHPEYVCPPGEERDRLKNLSLPLLLHLEGLESWNKPSHIESIISFFMMLGFKTVGDLTRFTLPSFQERWGETGALLWRRLHAQDRQVISPLLPTEPLEDYVHLDFPISLVSLLLHQMQKSLEFLFARLQGRRLFAQKLTLTLHCEYSKAHHKIEIAPNTPSRNRELFVTLLENRLSEIDLENPIRDFEVQVVPCPEKSQQLDFFEPRTSDKDKLQTLFSLLQQSQLKPGLYRIEPSILPEHGWRLAGDPEEIERHEVRPHLRVAAPSATYIPEEGESAIASQPHYGASVMQAPRPTRLLNVPVPLSLQELQRIKILSSNPIERLEDGWWESGAGNSSGLGQVRDYYFALSSEGQCLWIYQDLRTQEYFLHGYFD